MRTTVPPRGEITARGEKLYQERLRRILEPTHNGKYAVINIETGEYELDENHLAASKRAASRWPGGLFYAVRISSPTLGHIGARHRAQAE